MQPLAEASVENSVPMNSSTISAVMPVRRAASNSGVPAWPRYSHGIRPVQIHQVSVAAISSVIMPAMVPNGSEREGERTSSAAWQVPSIPR